MFLDFAKRILCVRCIALGDKVSPFIRRYQELRGLPVWNTYPIPYSLCRFCEYCDTTKRTPSTEGKKGIFCSHPRNRCNSKFRTIITCFECPICGEIFEFKYRFSPHFRECQAEQKRITFKEAITPDLKIISDEKASKIRKDVAIYRLYRFKNMTPKDISYFTKWTETRIKRAIGRVFKALCVRDDKCVFRTILEGKKLRDNE